MSEILSPERTRMIEVRCPRCGALVTVRRIGRNKHETSYGIAGVTCDESRESGFEVQITDCKSLDNAINDAIASGRV